MYLSDETILDISRRVDKLSRSLLDDSDDRSAVNHYLKYREVEMAFEILGLALMSSEERPSRDVLSNLIEIGESLDMVDNGIYDPDFWIKFLSWSAS